LRFCVSPRLVADAAKPDRLVRRRARDRNAAPAGVRLPLAAQQPAGSLRGSVTDASRAPSSNTGQASTLSPQKKQSLSQS